MRVPASSIAIRCRRASAPRCATRRSRRWRRGARGPAGRPLRREVSIRCMGATSAAPTTTARRWIRRSTPHIEQSAMGRGDPLRLSDLVVRAAGDAEGLARPGLGDRRRLQAAAGKGPHHVADDACHARSASSPPAARRCWWSHPDRPARPQDHPARHARAVRPRCRTMFLAHYLMDASTGETRAAFLEKVRHKIAAF